MKNHCCSKFRFLMPLGIIAFVALFTYAVYALWNGVLTDVLGVKMISYWQALGLLVLGKILFGGFPHRGGCRCGGFREHMMSRRWDAATPEQREKMREEMRHRFGDWPRPMWCESDDKTPESPDKGTKA